MKKLYVYSPYNYSSLNDIMRSINVHIVFRHILALLVTTFSGVPNSCNLIIRRAFLFKLANIIVYVGMLSMLLTRIAKKHLSSNPRFVSKIYAMSTTDNIGQHNITIDTLCLLDSFGI